MLTFDEIRAAIIMMKRAPLKGEEALIVGSTILKLERMAMAMMQPKPDKEENDDTGPAE